MEKRMKFHGQFRRMGSRRSRMLQAARGTVWLLVAALAMAAVRSGNPAVPDGGVQLLLPGQYRKSAGYPVVKDLPWHELYKQAANGAWYLAPSAVKTRRGHDECVDEEVLIIAPQHEDAVVLFTPFPGMVEQPTTAMEGRALIPGRTLEFSLGGKAYTLRVEGQVLGEDGMPLDASQIEKANEEELASQVITGFRLVLHLPGGKSCELVRMPRLEYVLPMVTWAGDLNGDGLPDLVLELPAIPESRHCFLFLSDPNDAQCPLKKAADSNVVNDC